MFRCGTVGLEGGGSKGGRGGEDGEGRVRVRG